MNVRLRHARYLLSDRLEEGAVDKRPYKNLVAAFALWLSTDTCHSEELITQIEQWPTYVCCFYSFVCILQHPFYAALGEEDVELTPVAFSVVATEPELFKWVLHFSCSAKQDSKRSRIIFCQYLFVKMTTVWHERLPYCDYSADHRLRRYAAFFSAVIDSCFLCCNIEPINQYLKTLMECGVRNSKSWNWSLAS